MAASSALEYGATVTLFERRPSLGRKLLVAGSSGLNVAYDAPAEALAESYRNADPTLLRALREFSVERWLEFLKSLGQDVFLGTSRRWFVREMKAAGLLRAWTERLREQGAVIETGMELADLDCVPGGMRLKFGEDEWRGFDRSVFALGGGSWEPSPPRWPEIFRARGLSVQPFAASNVGYELEFPQALLTEAEGKPIKNCVLKTARGERQGELVITRYGLEGTPVYAVGVPGPARLNLKPDVSHADLVASLSAGRENLAPFRRLQKYGRLSDAALALVFHLSSPEARASVDSLAQWVQAFPLELQRPRPLSEAISSTGGVRWEEVDDCLGLRMFPGAFAAGEMIDWDAPTGGYLIHASVALGAMAGRAAAS